MCVLHQSRTSRLMKNLFKWLFKNVVNLKNFRESPHPCAFSSLKTNLSRNLSYWAFLVVRPEPWGPLFRTSHSLKTSSARSSNESQASPAPSTKIPHRWLRTSSSGITRRGLDLFRLRPMQQRPLKIEQKYDAVSVAGTDWSASCSDRRRVSAGESGMAGYS